MMVIVVGLHNLNTCGVGWPTYMIVIIYGKIVLFTPPGWLTPTHQLFLCYLCILLIVNAIVAILKCLIN